MGRPAYTMNEAAAELRISRRNLQELVKDHPYFYSNGSRKLFTDGDIAALIQAMRQEAESCRLSYIRNYFIIIRNIICL